MLHTVSNPELLGAALLVFTCGALLYMLGRVHGRLRGYTDATDDLSSCCATAEPATGQKATPPVHSTPRYETGYGVRRVGYAAQLPNGHANPCLCDACCGMYGPPSPR